MGSSFAEGGDFIYLWASAADTGILEAPSVQATERKLNSEQVDRMLSLLKHDEKRLRVGVAVSLARLGVSTDESVEILFGAMNDRRMSDRPRDAVVEALARIGENMIIERFFAQLEVDEDYIRTRSMLALLGINSQQTLLGLCERLNSGNPMTRYLAAAGLAVFARKENGTAVEALKQALTSETDSLAKSEMERVLELTVEKETINA